MGESMLARKRRGACIGVYGRCAKMKGDDPLMQAPVRVAHIASWVRSIGGVETLLARHAEKDAGGGLSATQFSLFDRPPYGGVREGTMCRCGSIGEVFRGACGGRFPVNWHGWREQ